MLIIFIIEILILGLLYFYSNAKYGDFNEIEHKKGYLSIILMPVALLIYDSFLTGRFNNYERKLSGKLSELYGVRDIKQRLTGYLVRKIIYMIVCVLAVSLFGIFMDKLDATYLIFASTVLFIVFYATDKELDQQIKKKNFYIQYEFPDFLNKLVLLISAGMTVPRAWEKIVRDRNNMTPLYKELNTTYLEIRNGKPEIEAYEDFAKRCRVKEITKFVSAIMQNLRKGNAELVSLLKLQSDECWQLRKAMARKLGEEASTKLVLPLMIMFIGILVIVILPAVLQLKTL